MIYMTLEGYIRNPAGSKASVIANRKMYEDMYHDKYGKVMTRENGVMEYKLYYDKKGAYVAHLKVPSEAVEKFYYDVVFKFNNPKNRLDQAETEFFSNDPRFNYTFAYAFKKHKMTIKELESKMAKVALRKSPKDTNPDETIGYVKAFYFAYIYMHDKGLFHVRRFESEAGKLDWKILSKLIMQTEDKIEARQDAAAKSEKKQKEKDAVVPFGKRDIKHPEFHQQSAFLGTVNRVSKVGMKNIHSTKKIGSGKKSKKIGKI